MSFNLERLKQIMYGAQHWSYKSLNVAIVAEIFIGVIAECFKSTLNLMIILNIALRTRKFLGRLHIIFRITTKAVLELVSIDQFFIWIQVANSV